MLPRIFAIWFHPCLSAFPDLPPDSVICTAVFRLQYRDDFWADQEKQSDWQAKIHYRGTWNAENHWPTPTHELIYETLALCYRSLGKKNRLDGWCIYSRKQTHLLDHKLKRTSPLSTMPKRYLRSEQILIISTQQRDFCWTTYWWCVPSWAKKSIYHLLSATAEMNWQEHSVFCSVQESENCIHLSPPPLLSATPNWHMQQIFLLCVTEQPLG